MSKTSTLTTDAKTLIMRVATALKSGDSGLAEQLGSEASAKNIPIMAFLNQVSSVYKWVLFDRIPGYNKMVTELSPYRYGDIDQRMREPGTVKSQSSSSSSGSSGSKKSPDGSEEKKSDVKVTKDRSGKAPRKDDHAEDDDLGDIDSDDGEQIIESVMHLSANDTYDDLEDLNKIYAYQGFDPAKIAVLMKERESDTETLYSDLRELLGALLIRGSNTENMMRRMERKGATKLKALIAKYRIKKNAGQNTAVITLPRLCATFPMIAARLKKRGIGRDLAPGGDLPNPLRFMGAAVLTKGDDNLFRQYLEWAKRVDFIINRGQQTDVERYANIQRSSPLLNETTCRALLRELLTNN